MARCFEYVVARGHLEDHGHVSTWTYGDPKEWKLNTENLDARIVEPQPVVGFLVAPRAELYDHFNGFLGANRIGSEEIPDVEVDYTIVGGEVRFERGR